MPVLGAGDSMSDLEAEMVAAAEAMSYEQCMSLARMGVACWPLLTERRHLGIARVRASANDLFDYEESAPVHVVLAVGDKDGALVDLLAFEPRDPRGWLLRTGNGQALGEDRISDAIASMGWPDPPTLVLHPNPLEWLKADCRGACVVDDFSPDICARLRELPRIVVHNHGFAQALLSRLAERHDLPRIDIVGGADAA